MDLQPIHHQEATSSSSASTHQLPDQDSSFPTTSTPSRPLRYSARVKAAKQKLNTTDKGKERETSTEEQEISASGTHSTDSSSSRPVRATTHSKRSRDSVSKGKGKQDVYYLR
ncbi:hypothetical protein BDQ12DRAFT_517010 [Crucibulum laeve]|uniref:Uncharacterized protein n=1 Tax=Crucibulum laeve TaxID=68775 RepID=A0A5C3M4W1_9AGAR|nr:hypothetical protein BDQ12DRAFT_517010 [Crucibulum laeve]